MSGFFKFLSFQLLLALFLPSCRGQELKRYKIEIVKEYPHDENAYTQGLFFHNGFLYESTGGYGESTFRLTEISSGKSSRKLDFASKYFVEGSVILENEIFILTWTNKAAFVYDAQTLEYKATFSYPREGWGLTTDGKSLIASDGSARLFFMDKQFRTLKVVNVKLNGKPVTNINELEYVEGKIWANVYMSDIILIIDPESGKVEATIDCTGLLPERLRDEKTDVLNGIAFNPQTKKVYLTGKYWKRLYEIKLIEK